MAKVLGVGGVFFKCSKPRKLAEWYSHCLGFPLVAPGVAIFNPASMPPDGYTVWSAFPSSSRYFKPSEQSFMLNLVVDDLEEALRQVAAAGGTLVGRVRDDEYGRFGWFLDPAGNKVELWQPPQPQPRRSRKRR